MNRRINLLSTVGCVLLLSFSLDLAAGTLPYSPDLGIDEMRSLVSQDLRTEARGALLDHPEALAGAGVDQVRIVVNPVVTFDDEEGFVLQSAEVKILVPEAFSALDSPVKIDLDALRSHVEATLRESEAGRLWQDDEIAVLPAKLEVKAGWYRPAVSIKSTPLRRYGIWIAVVSALLMVSALALEMSRRFKVRGRKTAAVNASANPSVGQPVKNVAGDGDHEGFWEHSKEALELTPSLVSRGPTLDVSLKNSPYTNGWRENEILPLGSTDALQALAEMPLDEAIDVLTRFDQGDRQSIIEHLPLHPALKQRLRKGLSI